MAVGMNNITVNVGDTIEVAAQGIKVRGTVAVVSYWGDDYGWDIEIKDANVPGGYSRWKQRDDGGYIVKVNGKEVPR